MPASSIAINNRAGRRRVARIALETELRFSYQYCGSVFRGTGRTKDVSSSGIGFESDHQIPCNTEIELVVAWPVRLQEVCPLELVTRGFVVRANHAGHDPGYAVQIATCEFRTCGDRSFDQKTQPACSVLG